MAAVQERQTGHIHVGNRLSWSWRVQRRRRSSNDPFFEEGDLVCSLARKQLPLEETEDLLTYRIPEFVCSISRCSKTFNNTSSYEAHYNSCHRNVCNSCGRSLPSSHLLDLHILETHDSMFEILVAKQNMYQCLVEECPMKFGSPAKRKDHLVRVHHYPANFRFHRTKTPKSKKTGDTKQKESVNMECMETDTASSSENRKCESDQQRMITDNSDHEKTTSHHRRVFSYNVPGCITFGQGVTRGFYRRGKKQQPSRGKKGKHWHQQTLNVMDVDTTVDIESVKMDDLVTAISS